MRSDRLDAVPKLAAVPTREIRRWGKCDGGTRWTGGVNTLSVVRAAIACVVLLCYGVDGVMSEEGRAQERVKILELRVPSMSLSPALYNAMNAGFNASLWSRNYTLADGFRVERIVKEMEVHGGADAIKEAMKEHKDILLLQGPVGDEPLYHSLAALKEHDLVSFAPLTGSSIVRNWNPHLYFVRTDPAAELLALIHYAVNELRMWRLGFMYLQNVSFGDYEYTRTLDLLNDMDYELCGVFTLKSSLTKSTDDGVFNATWEEFAATRPQAVIVFGAPLKDTAKFVTRMLTDERTAGACLLLPGTLQDGLLETWREAVNGGAPFIPGQVITTGTNPLAKDTQYEAIKRFQTVMERYLASEENKVYNSTKHFLENDNDGEMMVAGWIDGEVLWKALNSHRWARERGSFRRSILSQRRYLIDDLVIGDYGGDCSATAAEEGAICRCNQGGRTVYMKRFVEGYRAEKIMSGELTLPFLKCYTGDIRLYPPLNGIFFLMTDDTYAMRATLGMRAGASAALQGWSNAMNTRIAVLQIINTSTADAKTTLRDEEERKRTHAVCGVMTEEMLDDETVVFIDPQNLHPHLNKFRRRVIRLSTTLEQEFFVLAQYLGNTTSANTTSANTHAVIRSGEAAAVVNVLRRSLVTFGGSLWSSALLAGGDALGDYLPHDGDVFVVGLAAADISVIAVHLAKHSSVRVFVLWSEVSLFYDEFVAAFNGSAAAAGRLAFATSLPHWADESTTSETVQRFHAAVKDKREWTPLTLRAFASTLLLKTVLSRMDLVNADAVIDFFYKNVVVVVGDIVYGPFKDGKRCGSPKNVNGNECAVNYGARHISVWSMARVVDPSVPELFPAVTPSMEYTGFPEERFLSDQFIAIIVGSATGVLLAAIIVGLLCRQRDARDNNNAPKETTDPVTLVFTDIESSTALWAACPEIMPDAVATHHRL
ncbi:receptor-type adenylate cyclase, partial [Trypanosoma grayi]|uniref:receptor-type adenylate cyclase n=1 Tax=Trypanosoma grayi TaxID=71804 RepID=UPI0004F49D4B